MMVNKLRSLCENKTHTSKRQRSNFCVDLSPDVGPETGMCITTMNILCISVCHTFILLNEYIFSNLKQVLKKPRVIIMTSMPSEIVALHHLKSALFVCWQVSQSHNHGHSLDQCWSAENKALFLFSYVSLYFLTVR